MVINENEQAWYISADRMARQTELPKKPLEDLMPCAKIRENSIRNSNCSAETPFICYFLMVSDSKVGATNTVLLCAHEYMNNSLKELYVIIFSFCAWVSVLLLLWSINAHFHCIVVACWWMIVWVLTKKKKKKKSAHNMEPQMPE